MDLFEALKERRSVRAYKDEPKHAEPVSYTHLTLPTIA